MGKYNLISPPIYNYKASKNLKLNVHTYFLSLAHSDTSGYNVCPKAQRLSINENNKNKSNCSYVCVAKNGKGNIPVVKNARIRKTKLFFEDRDKFMELLYNDIKKAIINSEKENYKPTFRLNAYSDIKWENIKYNGMNLMDHFPDITFYDYTKLVNRKIPKNASLTYSYWGNDKDYKIAIEQELNVAMVFDTQNNKNLPLPSEFNGRKVIDGDLTDLRTKENDGNNVIVGLRAKMSKANIEKELQKDISFVVRA